MPAPASESRSAAWPNCGWRREPGNVRMSASVRMPASSSSAMNSSIVRVPWPTLQMRIHRVWNTRSMADFDIRPVKPALHDDVMRFFDLSAYADNPHWASCYDTWPLAKSGDEHNSHTKEQNRATRSAVIRSGIGNGLVAYRLGRVVGWCHAAPKSEIPILAAGDPTAPSDTKTGAIVCFVVAPDARKQ